MCCVYVCVSLSECVRARVCVYSMMYGCKCGWMCVCLCVQQDMITFQ